MVNHLIVTSRQLVEPSGRDSGAIAAAKRAIAVLLAENVPVTHATVLAMAQAQEVNTGVKRRVSAVIPAYDMNVRKLVATVATLQLPAILLPDENDCRVLEVLKLAIRELLDASEKVTRNNVRARAKLVHPPSGRKPGLAKSTLDRNVSCRRIFEAAMTYEARLALRNRGSIDAHVARQTRDQLFALLGSYMLRTERRRRVLDHGLQRLANHGGSFDTSTLDDLEHSLDLHPVARKRTELAGFRKSGSAAAARSFSLVRRSIARLKSPGTTPTRKTIVDGTAQFNGGKAISDSTIVRNPDCRRLVDLAIGYAGPTRTVIAPIHFTKRDLEKAVQAARSLWRETRRLSFLVADAVADLDDASHRAEAAERARAHYEAEVEAERIIAASSAARS